ncbi:Uncharacterised protein [Vibrio cholerae]|uniref:Uncharacterized protein n=1 Tax=Vibrio cholerae TaxID=666 RepID=A0A655XZP9_VIBCL|nr:Uncharacterised protein [Vibrio cholerae]
MDDGHTTHLNNATEYDIHRTSGHQATHSGRNAPGLDAEHNRCDKSKRRGEENGDRAAGDQLEKQCS